MVHEDETAKAFKKIEKLFHAVASISFSEIVFQYDGFNSGIEDRHCHLLTKEVNLKLKIKLNVMFLKRRIFAFEIHPRSSLFKSIFNVNLIVSYYNLLIQIL